MADLTYGVDPGATGSGRWITVPADAHHRVRPGRPRPAVDLMVLIPLKCACSVDMGPWIGSPGPG